MRRPLIAGLALLAACGREEQGQLSTFVPADAGGLQLKVPPGWQRVEVTGMRKGEWRVPGEGGADATFTVYSFGEAAGSPEQNLERWQGQFEQDPPGNARTDPLRFPGRKSMPALEVEGTYVAETAPGSGQRRHDPGWKLIAIIATVRGATYYLKFVGPKATVDRATKDFHTVLAQIRD